MTTTQFTPPVKRDAGIELYRCLLMFGIVLLHSINMAGYRSGLLTDLLCWTVDGFIFISGFYGIRFKISKFIILFAMAFFCAGISHLVFPFLKGDNFTLEAFVVESIKRGRSYWFLVSYAILMLASPMLNDIVDKNSKKTSWWFPIIILTIWSWFVDLSGEFSVFHAVVPRYNTHGYTPGLGSLTPVTLIIIYIIARFFAKYQNKKILSNKKFLLIIMLFSLMIVAVGHRVSSYASPFAILIAGSVFFLFKEISLPRYMQKIILFIAPSMFGVYLLHSTFACFGYMNLLETKLLNIGVPKLLIYFPVAIYIFTICLIVDLLRRSCCSLWHKKWHNISTLLDSKINNDTVSQ